MRNLLVKNNKIDEPIPVSIYEKSLDKVIIFVSGSGDSKQNFYPIIKSVRDNVEHTLVCFSFRGRETDKNYDRAQQVQDLKDVINHLIEGGYKEIILVPFSMGFLSVSSILSTNIYSKCITDVIMFDPADYPTDGSRGTWSGSDKFDSDLELYSDGLENIEGDFKINIIFFGLRNFDPANKPRTNKERGVDKPDFATRLNIKMSKNIHNQIPEKNRGKFIIDPRLPHAFLRDGNIERNIKDISNYIKKFIDE